MIFLRCSIINHEKVGDKLREMLLNESSYQADLFNPDEQSEFIFQLFKILAVGGALCQTDSNISRFGSPSIRTLIRWMF